MAHVEGFSYACYGIGDLVYLQIRTGFEIPINLLPYTYQGARLFQVAYHCNNLDCSLLSLLWKYKHVRATALAPLLLVSCVEKAI